MTKWTFAALIIFTTLLAGCASQTTPRSETNRKSDQQTVIQAAVAQEPDRFTQVYQFQHGLLPEWAFNSDGRFFADLMQGDEAFLRETAAGMIDEEYAQALRFTPMPDHNAVLIDFPRPFASPLCFYALIIQDGDGFRFITYERTLEMAGEADFVGVVGFWRADGSRGNDGPRSYSSADDFVDDVLGEQ
ncbi:hypothetical protein ACQ5ES_09405 [Pseudidiomarina sp. E22-M8]|uniref:hypothetical protein n=1 Tax=Pseudidiomarina sp. E22-M8 TaxID=3424768 RepID=UPI00403C4034